MQFLSFVNMCTSQCSGSCISLLKNNLINCKDALVKLNDVLINLTVCGASGGTDKKLFMTEIINLKEEARKLLDEVNHNGLSSASGKLISASSYSFQNLFEDNSFKERLDNLKQRIHVLSAQTLLVKWSLLKMLMKIRPDINHAPGTFFSCYGIYTSNIFVISLIKTWIQLLKMNIS